MRRSAFFLNSVVLALLTPAFGFAASPAGDGPVVPPVIAAPELTSDAGKMILLDPGLSKTNALDEQIAQTQARIKSGANVGAQVERLGWLFVEKARVGNDPGYYKLAEQCALCLQSANTNSFEALLLKGHVLHSLHHFKEAEPLALQLTAKRGLAFDFGLLGDVEYDQGKIAEAAAAYQKMVDLRPELQAYSRVAQLRWITGDLTGAVEAMTLAAGAGSPANAEPTAWTFARLSLFQLEAGDFPSARKSATTALQLQPDSAPALLALGRVQLDCGETNAAIASFAKAADLNHLPEAQWLWADALRAAGDTTKAAEVEKQIEQRGAVEDPRSFSLYLSTRGQQPQLALALAQREFDTRADVFTHDAAAWALQANGRGPEARAEITKALAEGTQNARLFFHAAVINATTGEKEDAKRYSRLAWRFRSMLYPSEIAQLSRIAPPDEFSDQHVSNLNRN
jgi:tetratricopeptide (TPR) repeat protein